MSYCITLAYFFLVKCSQSFFLTYGTIIILISNNNNDDDNEYVYSSLRQNTPKNKYKKANTKIYTICK